MAEKIEKEIKEEKEKKTTKKEKEEKSSKKEYLHEVEITIDGKEWENGIDKAFTKKQKTVKVDGFRQGKVPRSIFEKKFGKEALYLDAADEVLNAAFNKAMEKSKLEPIVQPAVELKNISDKGVTFLFKIITKPTVTVKKYKGLNVVPEKVEVSEEEVNHEIGHLLERYTELVSKDSSVADGDVAIIDFEGFKDGVAFDGGKGENYSLEIGSHTFIPGFEEQVIGMKAGEEKDINVTFPEDYGAKELAGSPVVFKVKVNEVKEKKTRELDEEFFEDLGMEGVNSEEELRKQITDSISARKELDNENKYVDDLLEAVGKNVEVDIPQEMIDEETHRLLHRFEDQMKMQGISLEVYYQFTGTDENALKAQIETEAYKNVLYRLMLDEIMSLEKISVTQEEVDKDVEELSKKYNMPKDEFLKQFGGEELVRYDLEVRKTVDKLKELNK